MADQYADLDLHLYPDRGGDPVLAGGLQRGQHRNDIVRNISYFLYAITEPALRPIRAFMPDLGGIDISPVILMIGLIFLDKFIIWLYIQMIT